ncbi:MAG TPA: hypothetical protein DD640_06995, partial [Clostridiales bacterium]|nr:hypothetical protein [Clostridiales bacterium]
MDITDECQLLGGKCFWKNTTGADVVFRVQSSSHQDRVWPFAAGCRSSKMTPGYVDLTNPDATRCFIEYTHDRYKQYIGAEFGRTVRGVFTDEPGFMWQAYPVSDHLIAGLARKYGPDVPRLLYLLFAENDGRAAAFRRDYYEVLHRLMIDSFLSVNIQWCEANNLLFTGHINGEESLACNLNDGETLPRLRGFGIPGVDLIWITVRMFWPDFDTLCATIANITHFSGKERMLCETYTLSTWSLTMQHMRRVASRLLPSGVNMMQYMGCHYTFAGIKTTHAGPDNGVYNVLFPYYHIFSDYGSRLSGLSAETVPQAKVAVLQPLTAGYEHTVNYEYPEREGHAHISRSHFKQIMNTYDSVINSLSRHNIGFELLYESQLLEDGVSVCDGKLCVPNPAPIRETAAPNTYEVVILPMARCTQGKTRKLLEQFVREGGRLILAGDVPAWDIDDFVPYNLGDLAAAAEEAAALRRGEWAQKQTRCLFPAPGVQVILSNELGLAESGFRDAVKAGIAAAGVVDDLEVEAPEGIFSIRRRDAEGVRYFFLTNNRTEPASAQVRVRTGQPSLLLDVENSTVIRSLEAADCLTLPPCVCQVIVSAPQEQLDQFLAAFPPAPVYAKAEDIPLASFSFRACGPNTRRLDFGLYKDAAALSGADGQTIWNTVS